MLNFLFNKTREQRKSQNTLGEKTDPKSVVTNFVKFTSSITESRQTIFARFISFALESEQWTRSEILNKDDADDQALVFNFSQEYIDRYMAKLFPRNPHTGVLDIGVKVTGKDKEKSQKYEQEILDIYEESALPNILLEQGIDFLTGGASCFYYPRDPITKRADIFSIDPTNCYLGWANGRLVQFAFREYQGDGKYKTIYYDLTNIIIVDEKTGKVETTKNEFDFIPFSWIPNNPKPHSHEGISKMNLLLDLDRAYNRTASNFDKRIEENTEPHILIKSDQAKSSNIHRGRKKQTRLGAEDDMKYLELQEGEEILNWLNKIEARIKSKTGIVNSSDNLLTNVSGKSLSFQFSDMTDLIGFMRLRWDTAFREMNKAILTYKFGIDKYKTSPIYQPFLKQDNAERVDEYAVMIENDIISRKDAITELRGVENAEDKLDEIFEEQKKFDSLNKKEEEKINSLNKKEQNE